MSAELMDIELLAEPLKSSLTTGQSVVLLIVLLAVLLVLLWIGRRIWQAPGLVIWRWQQRLKSCNTPLKCRALALEIYVFVKNNQLVLTTELNNQLHQACFAEDTADSQTLAKWLLQLKAQL